MTFKTAQTCHLLKYVYGVKSDKPRSENNDLYVIFKVGIPPKQSDLSQLEGKEILDETVLAYPSYSRYDDYGPGHRFAYAELDRFELISQDPMGPDEEFEAKLASGEFGRPMDKSALNLTLVDKLIEYVNLYFW